MPEPTTTIGLGAVGAYLAKDGLNKLLGPTAEFLGDKLREFTERRAEAVGRIFRNASHKLGSKVEEPGMVPPRVLKEVINEGSYSTENISIEYMGASLHRHEHLKDEMIVVPGWQNWWTVYPLTRCVPTT